MQTHETPASRQTDSKASKFNWPYVVGVIAAFLVGLIPGWYMAHTSGTEREQAQRSLKYYRLIDESSAAGLYAARGEYETARQNASSMFSDLRAARDQTEGLNAAERETADQVLQQRDDVITLLARNDAAAQQRLLTIEYQLRQAFRNSL